MLNEIEELKKNIAEIKNINDGFTCAIANQIIPMLKEILENQKEIHKILNESLKNIPKNLE